MLRYVPVKQYTICQSTHILAQQWFAKHPQGVAVLAQQQYAGHGRQGRVWHSPAGNLYGSLYIPFRAVQPPCFWPFFWSLVVQNVIQAYVPTAECLIKWPNDILLHRQKVAGILITQTTDALGVGIGINIQHAPPECGATVLTSVAPRSTLPTARALWQQLFECADNLLSSYSDNIPLLYNDWMQAALPIDTPMRVRTPQKEFVQGTFAGITPDGALRLKTINNTEQLFYAADVIEL